MANKQLDLIQVGDSLQLGVGGPTLSNNAGVFEIDGTANIGIPSGGTANQVLEKIDGDDYNVQWATSGFDPGSNQTITGRWGFQVVSGSAESFWLGDGDPFIDGTQYFVSLIDASQTTFLFHGSEETSTNGSGADFNLNINQAGGSVIGMGTASNAVTLSDDGEGNASVECAQQTSAMTGGTADDYIATKKYVDDSVSIFDPSANQTITGQWGFDTSTSDKWWAGDDEPFVGSPLYWIQLNDLTSDLLFQTGTTENTSTFGSTAALTATSNVASGGSTSSISAGPTSVKVDEDGEGGFNATLTLQTSAMTGGISNDYIATKKYVDDSVIDFSTPDTWTGSNSNQTIGQEELGTSKIYSTLRTSIQATPHYMMRGIADAATYGQRVAFDTLMVSGADTTSLRYIQGVIDDISAPGSPTYRSTAQYTYNESTGAAAYQIDIEGFLNGVPLNCGVDPDGSLGSYLRVTGASEEAGFFAYTGAAGANPYSFITGEYSYLVTQTADMVGGDSEKYIATKKYVDDVKLNLQTGTTYTVVAADNGRIIRCTNAAAITLTINTDVELDGFNFMVEQSGAGAITFAGTSTRNNIDAHTKTRGLYAAVSFWSDGVTFTFSGATV